MAYHWEDKIVDYYWSNPELDTVAILWQDPTDEKNREHYIKVDEEDQQWLDFVKIVPYEKINERTEVRHESFREEFREAFRGWMERPENNMTEKEKEIQYVDRDVSKPPSLESVFETFFKYDEKDTSQKEDLFKFKLKIFEQEIVKNSKSSVKFKNAKTFIRKAENPLDVLLGYLVFTSDAELKLTPKEKFVVEGVYVPIKD